MPKKPDILWPFVAAEAILGTPIALAAGAAIFQFISSGEVSPATDFWLWFSVVGLGGPMIILAAIHAVASEKD